jgi:hypothetical protein
LKAVVRGTIYGQLPFPFSRQTKMQLEDDVDDIAPQLSTDEATAIMRGGLGAAELAFVNSLCTPIYWATGRPLNGEPRWRNWTAHFLDAGEGAFGVTACHVIYGWMRDQREGGGPLCLATNGNPLVLDWSERVIAAHSALDIAIFRISEREVADLGKTVLMGSQKNWPPQPPAVNCGIYYCGYPRVGKQLSTVLALSFGAVVVQA